MAAPSALCAAQPTPCPMLSFAACPCIARPSTNLMGLGMHDRHWAAIRLGAVPPKANAARASWRGGSAVTACGARIATRAVNPAPRNARGRSNAAGSDDDTRRSCDRRRSPSRDGQRVAPSSGTALQLHAGRVPTILQIARDHARGAAAVPTAPAMPCERWVVLERSGGLRAHQRGAQTCCACRVHPDLPCRREKRARHR